MRSLTHLADIAAQAAQIGHDRIKNTRPQSVTEKADRDTYTEVDLQIEREIRAYLAQATPEIGFLGEEEGHTPAAGGDDLSWVLDPIDGTANFVHGVPLSAVSLALTLDDEPIVGVVSLPYLNLTYSATKGGGAYVNGTRIQASKTTDLANAMVSIGDYATGDESPDDNKRRLALTAALAERVERVRMFGSAAHDLVWVAEGRTDATIILDNKPWDVAAGVIIAREAGVRVIDSNGTEHTAASAHTIAAAAGVANLVLDLVQRTV